VNNNESRNITTNKGIEKQRSFSENYPKEVSFSVFDSNSQMISVDPGILRRLGCDHSRHSLIHQKEKNPSIISDQIVNLNLTSFEVLEKIIQSPLRDHSNLISNRLTT
jgi:hypothetical protein